MSRYENQLRQSTCAKCGKVFFPAPLHVFKVGSKYYCKWTCYNHRDDDKPKKKEESKC